MKSRLVVAVVVLVVVATGAWAQGIAAISPRAAGMGGAATAVCDDAVAWAQNPAGLAALSVPCKEGTEYGNDVLFGYANNDATNAWGLSWSGWKPADRIGFGAAYADAQDMGSMFGAGFGAGLKDCPLSAGLNVMALNPDLGEDHTILNVGLLYRLGLGKDAAPLKVGMTVTDVTDELGAGALWNVGLAWKATKDLLLAVDLNDVSDQLDLGTQVSGGAELAFGGKAKEWRARVGVMDTGNENDVTVGVGYQAKQWRADFAWVNTDPDATWSIGVGVNL